MLPVRGKLTRSLVRLKGSSHRTSSIRWVGQTGDTAISGLK